MEREKEGWRLNRHMCLTGGSVCVWGGGGRGVCDRGLCRMLTYADVC